MKERRQGTAQRYALDQGYTGLAAAYDYRPQESYEKVKDSDAIKYVIGAMAPVSAKSTQVSIDEGERVANTLVSMLETDRINTEFRLQGSVALDIHIEGHSDVDMLILKKDVVLIQLPVLPSTNYTDAPDRDPCLIK